MRLRWKNVDWMTVLAFCMAGFKRNKVSWFKRTNLSTIVYYDK